MSESDRWESEVAIIGMSGRFPKAPDIDAYWHNLCQGLDVISRSPNGSDGIRALGKLEGVDLFDAAFFNYTPREAEITDPQHRILLECAWDALDNAGYGNDTHRGSVGVFVGGGEPRYGQMLYSHEHLIKSLGGIHVSIGNRVDFLATRISYKLNLTGPSITLQTACSTSLVAVHIACQSILNGECDIALAGGVSLPSATEGIASEDGGVISSEGYCRAFDANAHGTVGGDGVGIVVLKRLAEAIADGDYIHGVIKGSAINNDGARKVGFTAPSVEGQARVITEAIAVSETQPETITYVEAHGTGTPLGDPIEVTALTQAFGKGADLRHCCAMGSVKTNIGHTDAAAGVSGLIKTILALKHKLIPPSLHFETPNPEIDFANSPFYVTQNLAEWKRNGTPRRAGVSSFGMGGTNAHIILEEAPERDLSSGSSEQSLLVLSAKTASGLVSGARNLADYLRRSSNVNLADVAYTLQIGRRAFPYRWAWVGDNPKDAIAALEALDSESLKNAIRSDENRAVNFLIPGYVSEDLSIHKAFYEKEPALRENVIQCCELLEPQLGMPLRQILLSDHQHSGRVNGFDASAIADPALFVIGWSLANTWLKYGIRPRLILGDGIGEYVAACLAEVFSLEEALALIAERFRVQQVHPAGSEPKLISEAALVAFRKVARAVRLKTPKLPFLSGVTGNWITASEATDPEYWVKHLHCVAGKADGFAKMLNGPNAIFLEIGPGRTMSESIRQSSSWKEEHLTLASMPEVHQDLAAAPLLSRLGQMWVGGVEVNWPQIHKQKRRQRLPLPGYPFERQAYWIEPTHPVQTETQAQQRSSDEQDVSPQLYMPSWKRTPIPRADNANGFGDNDCFLAFVASAGIGSKVLRALENEGKCVVRVLPGHTFSQVNPFTFIIDPQQREHYDLVLNQIAGSHKTLKSVLHMWTLASGTEAGHEFESFKENQVLGFYSLFWLAQALRRANFELPLCLNVISCYLQDVTGQESLHPAKATVLGACRVIPQEYPNIRCRSIDVEGMYPHTLDIARVTQQIVQEVKADISELQVAYRGSNRLVAEFEKISLPPSSGIPSCLKAGGVYLFTGNLADSDLQLARFLSQTIKAKLVFLAPADFPDRTKWDLCEASLDANDKTIRSIRQLREIEAFGSEILVMNTNLHDEQQVIQAVRAAANRFGKINGVIHRTLGAERRMTRLVQDTDESFLNRQLEAHVRALAYLEAAIQTETPDFFMLVQPLTSISGEKGKGAATAIGCFMESHALLRNRNSVGRWMVVNSSGWHTPGNEKEGQEIFTRIMSGDAGVHLVLSVENPGSALNQPASSQRPAAAASSVADLPVASDRVQPTVLPAPTPASNAEGALTTDHVVSQQEPAKSVPSAPVPGVAAVAPQRHPRPNLAVPYVAPGSERERSIVGVWQELLGINDVGINDNFFLLGGDSVHATQMISRLRSVFNVEIPMSYFFEFPTVALMSKAIQNSKESGKENAVQRTTIPRIPRAERTKTMAAAAAAGNGKLNEKK